VVSMRAATNLHWTRTHWFAAAKSEVRPAVVVKVSAQSPCKCCRPHICSSSRQASRPSFRLFGNFLASFLVCLLASWLVAKVQADGRQKCRPLGANIESDAGQMFPPLWPDNGRRNGVDDDYDELLRAARNATGWSCQSMRASDGSAVVPRARFPLGWPGTLSFRLAPSGRPLRLGVD